MIVVDQKADVKTNNVGTTSAFQLTVCPKAFKMISKDIYPNPVKAVIREVSCNAHDAHIEAGNDDQFEVHLPTELEPWFSVRDFGTGLSDKEMREVYTNVFKSTKSDSNDFTGAFGLGSKSPFSVDGTTNFTVISYYNGYKTTYSCYLDEHGLPVITDLHEPIASSEHDGLHVSVNVTRGIWKFTDEAVDVFKHFSPCPKINVPSVNRNIQTAKEKLHSNKSVIGENYSIQRSYDSFYVIMGNVAYKYSLPYSHSMNGLSGYIRVPIGSLEVDPGRENILDNDSNREFINKFLNEVGSSAAVKIIESIESESTEWGKYCRSIDYIGIANVLNISVEDYHPNTTVDIVEYYMNRGTCKASKTNGCRDLVGTEIFIHKPRFGNRIRNYVRTKDNKTNVTVIEKIDAIKLNIPPALLKDLDTLPKMVYKRSKSGGASGVPRKRGIKKVDIDVKEVRRYSFDNITVPIKSTEERVYVRICRNDCVSTSYFDVRSIMEFFGVTVFGINNAVFDRNDFNSKDGGWIEISDYARREISNYTIPISYSLDSSAEDSMCNFKYLKSHIDSISDTEVKDLITMSSVTGVYEEYKGICELTGITPIPDNSTDISKRVRAIAEKYPMVGHLNNYALSHRSRIQKDTVEYINIINQREES
jgi:hypothetical protein